jgi:hypothetical protein
MPRQYPTANYQFLKMGAMGLEIRAVKRQVRRLILRQYLMVLPRPLPENLGKIRSKAPAGLDSTGIYGIYGKEIAVGFELDPLQERQSLRERATVNGSCCLRTCSHRPLNASTSPLPIELVRRVDTFGTMRGMSAEDIDEL